MSATTASQSEAMPTTLKWGMALFAFYTVNMIHLPQSLGVPGLNVLNIICLVVWFMHVRTGRKSNSMPALSQMMFLLFFMIVYSFLVTQLTLPDDFMFDLMYLKAAIFYPLYFFIFYSVVKTEDDIRFMMYVILIIAMLAAYEAVREGLAYGNTTFHPMKRASGPFGDTAFTANRAGVFYAMFFAFALAISLYHPQPGNRWIRPLAILTVVILLGGTFYTFSRQSYLIIGIVAALMMMRRGPSICVILVLLGLNYNLWMPQAAIDRLVDTKQVDEEGVEEYDESTESRWIQWAAAGEMIEDKPWGVGFRRFIYLSESYGGKPMLDAHNHYVLFAAEASPLGTVVHIVLVLSLWRLGHRLDRAAKRAKNGLGRTLGSGFAFMSLAMILGNIYGSPFANGEVMGLYWAVGGMVARQLVNLRSPPPSAAAKESISDGESHSSHVKLRPRVRGLDDGAPRGGHVKPRPRVRGRDLLPPAAEGAGAD
ncbi:MAG: O-antigen ligase family protein [Alphaproteobacteria bacterium GM202ARS2]|nr:O-antigen ligase family protein [Alphaproteobacteria bacterium GM202ARS2]